jgi:hypothetical protein
MRLSIARTSAGRQTPGEAANRAAAGFDVRSPAWRRMALALSAVLMLGCIGIVFGSPKPAAAATVFSPGQVFASVGGSQVNVYDPTSGDLVDTLNDGTNEPYTAGSAFDANGNLYVTDDINGTISKYAPDGTFDGTFASGLTNPLSLVFDNQGNLYVGQQGTPYIAEFNSSGQSIGNFGPLTTGETGDDWIALSSDECTFYYTTETNVIYRYNKCTNTQLSTFNVAPFTGDNAFELQILPNGNVLVADSESDIMLDPNGNVVGTYSCADLPGCSGELFAIALDPDGLSFWTGDAFSGDIYRIDIASGDVLQTINTQSEFLFGLSVNNEIEVAAAPTVVSAAPTSLAIQPVSGSFSSPTPVSAVLTDSNTHTAIVNEPVTFTLNGSETCTADTDATGTATCDITASEPSSSYTLTASFSGDTSSSTPEGSDTTSSTFTVNPDSSTVTFTGPTTAVNGSPTTLSATLNTDNPTAGTPLPTKVVTFTIGSGTTAQSCSDTTDANGDASCTIATVDQPTTDTSVTTTFGGDAYDTASTSTTSATVTEPTSLMVSSATGDFSDATTVTGVLTNSITNAPISGEQVHLTLDNSESCTAMTGANGAASCSVTPAEAAATYSLTGTFPGDTSVPLQLMGSNGAANFVVTLEEASLSYTGPGTAQNGQPYTFSGVLTTDDPAPSAGIDGRSVVFTLGIGSSAQSCPATTNSSGAAACTITVAGQSPGPIPVTAQFASDGYYRPASAASTVNLPEGTQLTVNPSSGAYEGSTPVSGTLINTYTNQPIPNEQVTFSLSGPQSCTAITNALGVATCPLTPNEPQGSYPLSGTFAGDSTAMPQLNPTSSSNTITVTQAPTTLTYTGTTSVTNGQSATLSGVLTSSEPSAATDVAGRTVTFSLGSGGALQSCAGTTDSSGTASCTVTDVNQTTGTAGISVSFSGDNYYAGSNADQMVTVHTPTTLTVSAGTSDFADTGTVSAVLTNSVTGATIAGENVKLTLNSSSDPTQSCWATTNASGVASCSITPNEPEGSYSLGATFAGDTAKSPQLLPSSGTNTFVVTLEETAITYTGPSIAVSGMSITMTANLTTDGGPLSGRAVLMTLGSGSTAQSCTGTTNAAGVASCTIATVNQTAGSVPILVSFAGDAHYRPASASGSETTAAPPSGGGGFVIGDVSAGAPTVGRQVNFWGSQTWKTNQFSGVNNAPASMKGYIDNAPSYTCGAAWTSDPGNSSDPPSTIPVNMIVVVASSITQSGSTESGNIKHLVVVSTAGGYGPAPGHDGYGKIIATIC